MDPEALPIKDIHLPEAIGLWPPAWGWWVLAALLVAALVWSARRRLLAWRRKLVRRDALALLDRIESQYSGDRDGVRLAAELSALLRRAALSVYPRAESAALTGQAWLEFLDRRLDTPAFAAGPGQSLVRAPYQKRAEIPGEELIRACRTWIVTLESPT